MKYIPEQKRVVGRFPVPVNGTITWLKVGDSFADTPALLSALDGAGIEYADAPYTAETGVATGRVRIRGTGKWVRGGVNGRTVRLPVGEWFTPTDEETEALSTSSYTVEQEYGPELGPVEYSPDPGFDDPAAWASSAGTLVVAGSKARWTGAGTLTGQAAALIVPGTYRCVLTIDGLVTSPVLRITIGGAFAQAIYNANGVYTLDVVVADVADQNIAVRSSFGRTFNIADLRIEKIA